MTAPCCAACLHAISDPDRPVLFEGQLFHHAHLPVEALLALVVPRPTAAAA